MDKKLRKYIIEILRTKSSAVAISDFEEILLNDYGWTKKERKTLKVFKKVDANIFHIINVLEGERLISKVDVPYTSFSLEDGIKKDIVKCIELTAVGYKEFDPFYKKLWGFLNNDFAKLLSLVSLLLSIVATLISIYK